jgi:heptosyltransferase III
MRILVIRRDNIGDLVCATPLLAALRARYPQAHIAALVNSYNAGVLAGNPAVDAVHAYTKLKHRNRGESWLGTLLHRFRVLRELRKLQRGDRMRNLDGAFGVKSLHICVF